MKGDLSDRMNSRFTLRGKDKLKRRQERFVHRASCAASQESRKYNVTTLAPNTSRGTGSGRSCGVRTASVMADVTASSQITPPQALVSHSPIAAAASTTAK